MNIVIFGSGPVSADTGLPVMAPGARTWQIARTVAMAVAPVSKGAAKISLVTLEHESGATVQLGDEAWQLTKYPLSLNDFVALEQGDETRALQLPATIDAVVGCASLQPCSTAAVFAGRRKVPVWIDIFGDPFTELQTKFETEAEREDQNENLYVHAFRLILNALTLGDRFSGLSGRQRHALIGQLGAAGRLNRKTAWKNFVWSIPYGVFADSLSPPSPMPPNDEELRLLWCGSFNTWMDATTLADGFAQAAAIEPKLRLWVVGGAVAGYSEAAYAIFMQRVQQHGCSERIRSFDWQPVELMHKLYAQCHAGLSIDRRSYEAELGSRTRIINFLAHGRPVITSTPTELASQLARDQMIMPFRMGDAASLADAICGFASGVGKFAQFPATAQQYVRTHADATQLGQPLAEWVQAPCFAEDKVQVREPGKENRLIEYWHRVRAGFAA